MPKKILDAMKKNVISVMEPLAHCLLSISEAETLNKETGEVSRFIRCEAEVPRGYGALSRCRFSVKIPNGKIKVDEKELESTDYTICFHDLTVSYIDEKGNVYFRAEDYTIRKEGD